MYKMVTKENKGFDWNNLANSAASAANLLRAFEYAEEVFKTMTKAEQSMESITTEYNDKKLALDNISKEYDNMELQIAQQQKLAAETLSEVKDKFNSEHKIAVDKAEKELADINAAIVLAKNDFDLQQAAINTQITELRKELEDVKKQLTTAREEYKAFALILTSNMTKV